MHSSALLSAWFPCVFTCIWCLLPDSSVGKESACNAGDSSSIPGSGRFPGEGTGYSSILGLPLWLSWYRICLQCGRPGFDYWAGKIPWRRERLSSVFWPREFHGLYSPGNSPGQNTEVGSLFPSPGNLPNPGIKPRSPTLQADSVPAEPPGSPIQTEIKCLS